MPPRGALNCEPETGRLNGRAEGQQALRRDNGMMNTGSRMHHAHRLAGKGNVVPASAGEIPWRTSRRLQEATLRLIKERDGGYTHNQVTVKVKDDFRITGSMPPARSPKRPQRESEPTREKHEDHSADLPAEESGNPYGSESEQPSSATETGTASLRAPGKVKRRKVHFNDVYLYIGSVSSDAHDKDVPNHVSSPSAKACNRTAGGKVKSPVEDGGATGLAMQVRHSVFTTGGKAHQSLESVCTPELEPSFLPQDLAVLPGHPTSVRGLRLHTVIRQHHLWVGSLPDSVVLRFLNN